MHGIIIAATTWVHYTPRYRHQQQTCTNAGLKHAAYQCSATFKSIQYRTPGIQATTHLPKICLPCTNSIRYPIAHTMRCWCHLSITAKPSHSCKQRSSLLILIPHQTHSAGHNVCTLWWRQHSSQGLSTQTMHTARQNSLRTLIAVAQ